MKKSFSILALGLTTLSTTSSVFANSIPISEGEEIVVTATRRAEQVKNAITPTIVINAKELQERQNQSLPEILSSFGVQTYSNGGQGQVSGLFLRGTKNNQVLILIDGVRIESATAGRTAIEAIPIEQINRIEIVKGSLSSLYGANAIGGVIQIFTKNHSKTQQEGIVTTGSVTVGSHQTQKATAGIQSHSKQTDAFIHLGYAHSGGFSAMNSNANSPFYQPFDPDQDQFESRSINAGISHRFTDRYEISLNVLHSKLRNHYDGGLGLDHLNAQELSMMSLNNQYKINENHIMNVKLSHSEDKYADLKPNSSTFTTKSDQLVWQHDLKLSPNRQLSLGFDHQKQTVSSNSTNYTLDSRTINGVFMGYQADLNRHHWQLNVRHDDNSQFGTYTSGSVGYALDVNSQIKLNASAGKAYSMPTFNDLYYPSSAFYSGNPNLKPEESNQYQVGIQWIDGNHRLNVNYFNWKTNNLIVYSSDPVTFVGTMSNIDKAKNNGIEIDYRYTLPQNWRFTTHLTFQNPKNEATGKLLQRRSKQFGSFALNKSINERWDIGGEVIASSERFDDVNESKRLAGYSIMNLTSSYRVNKHWKVSGRIENLFDKQYEVISGYNTPSRGLFMTLSYQ